MVDQNGARRHVVYRLSNKNRPEDHADYIRTSDEEGVVTSLTRYRAAHPGCEFRRATAAEVDENPLHDADVDGHFWAEAGPQAQQVPVPIDALLPALEGSPKQVYWATHLRKHLVDDLGRGRSNAVRTALAAACAKATHAKWWIDNRHRLHNAIKTLVVAPWD